MAKVMCLQVLYEKAFFILLVFLMDSNAVMQLPLNQEDCSPEIGNLSYPRDNLFKSWTESFSIYIFYFILQKKKLHLTPFTVL